ncbi:MAG TPA: response regulator [Opitutaceae bacterium]
MSSPTHTPAPRRLWPDRPTCLAALALASGGWAFWRGAGDAPGAAAAVATLVLATAAFVELRRRAKAPRAPLPAAPCRDASDTPDRRILASARVAMITTAADGTIRTFNPAAERMLGYRADEVIGKATLGLFRISDDLAGASNDGELKPGSSEDREWTFARKDGSRFPVMLAASALHDDDAGGMGGSLYIARDISLRKKAERDLRSNQRVLGEFLKHAPAAVAILDRELRYLAISNRWITDYQLPSDDLVGRPHLEAFPYRAAEWHEILRRCLSGGIERRNADRIVLAHGGEEWIRWECRPWLDVDGQIGGVSIFSEIITAQVQAARLLQESEAQLQEAQQITHVGSWDYDALRQELRWSRETYRIHDLDPSSPIDVEQAISYYVPEHRDAIRGAFEHALREGTGWSLELEIQSAAGHNRWVRAMGRVEQRDGRIVRVYGTIQDISERKHWETMLLKAKDTALSAARVKSEFLANMSHEIRTPLNAVIGMTSLLLHTPLDGEQKDYAETIRTAGDGLVDLINDILDFSKLESDHLELERQPFSLRECVEAAVDLVAGKAAEKNLELTSWIDPDAPQVLNGDVTRLRQVLTNLLANAVKFTQSGEVFVSVDARAGAPAEPRLRFTVRDTGIGIPADRMDRLFQSFTQIDSSTTRHYGGTGLGLAISRRLVELMEGRIWAESEPLRGSRFHFEIPVQRAEGMPEVRANTALAGRRLLVIDDHATSREILRLLAESWGATAHATASPFEALGLVFEGEQFDAIVVDHQMPGMDGVQFIRQLRSQLAGLEIPVALLAWPGIKPFASETPGTVGTLAKPLKAGQLLAFLQKQLGAERRTTSTPPILMPAAPPPAEQPLRVLLVEDNPVNQRVARAMLEKMSLHPDLASHGREALEALERTHYDVVFMDVQMPEMDGLTATREIRARLPRERQPLIIAMTANALSGDREKCLEAGMDDYLAKPVRPDDLRARLEHWRTTGFRRGAVA